MKELICFDEYGNELNEWMDVPDESEQNSLHFTREIISQFFEKEKELRGLSGKERSIYELKYKFELQYYKQVYEDFSLFEENGKWGVKSNVFGLVTLAPIYDEVLDLCSDNPFTYTVCKVRLGNKYGCVCPDKNGGRMILPPIYDDVMSLNDYWGAETINDKIIIKQDGKYGLSCGYRVDLEPVYDKISLLDNDYFLTEKDGKFGLLGSSVSIPAEYDEIQVPEIMGWIKAKKGNVWGYFDVDGHFTEDISKAFHLKIEWFWDYEPIGLERSNQLFNDYSSLLNKLSFSKLQDTVEIEVLENGNVFDKMVIYANKLTKKVGLRLYVTMTDLIPPKYDELYHILGNEYAYRLNDKYGFVLADGKGTELCPPIYDEIKKTECSDFIALVRIGEKWGVAHFYDNEIPTNPEYDEIIEGKHHWYFKLLLKKEGKVGVQMDDIFIPPLYDGFFVPEVFGWIRVCKDGEWGYLDVNNEFTPDESKAYLCYRC